MPEKEVRLIDAELYRKALKSEMFQKDGEDRLDIQRAIILLDQTPSIYPERLRLHGKPVPHYESLCNSDGEPIIIHPFGYECPFCGDPDIKKFCPNCGAKMEVDNV